MAYGVGQTSASMRLLHEAEPLDLDPTDRTWLLWHLEQFEPRWTGATRVPALVEMAHDFIRVGDHVRALQVLDGVAFRCWWGNAPPETRALVIEAAGSLELPPSTPAFLSVLALADPVGHSVRVLEQLAVALAEPDREPSESFELGVAATAVWADDIAAPLLSAAASGARAQGRLGLLTQILVAQAWADIHLGRWDTASAGAAEAAALAAETSQIRWALVARLA